MNVVGLGGVKIRGVAELVTHVERWEVVGNVAVVVVVDLREAMAGLGVKRVVSLAGCRYRFLLIKFLGEVVNQSHSPTRTCLLSSL